MQQRGEIDADLSGCSLAAVAPWAVTRLIWETRLIHRQALVAA